jgi:hypothetical protein
MTSAVEQCVGIVRARAPDFSRLLNQFLGELK